MLKKTYYKVVLSLLVFVTLFTTSFTTLSSAQLRDNPSVSISSTDYSAKGVLQYSSIEDVKVRVSSHLTTGQGKVTVYEATLKDIFQYITHDKDYKQTKPKIDLSNRKIIATYDNINVSNKQGTEINLNLDKSGIWIVQAQLNNLSDETFVIRNTFGAMSKDSKDTIVVWAQNFSDKKILQNGSVKIYNFTGSPKILSSSNLDGDAVASLPLTIDADIAVVESNGESAIIPLNVREINQYFWASYRPHTPFRNYFSFTDRPIYKPGDAVNFKAIIRDDDDARYSLASGLVLAEISHGWDQSKLVFYHQLLTIDGQGNIDGQLKLPANAPTGDYSLTFSQPNSTDPNSYENAIYFQVENYRKPEYFLTSTTKQNDVIRGDKLNLDISAKLFSGQPLAGVSVHYKVYRDDAYDSEYYYPQDNQYYRAWWGEIIKEGDLNLDNKGKNSLSISTNDSVTNGKSQLYSVAISYNDASGNTASAGNNFYVRSGEYSLYRQADFYSSARMNQEYSLPLVLKANRSGLPLSREVVVKVKRNWWEKIQKPDQKYPTYEIRTEDLPKLNIKTNTAGNANIIFTPKNTGNYIFTTEIKDNRGNLINKDFYVWVSDNDNWYNSNPGNNSSLTITSDKDIYQPGETARLQINSAIPDRDVFLSIERGYMDRYQLIHITGNKTVVDLPLADHDMPNIFVSVSSFGNDKLDTDVKNLTVSAQKMKLNITLNTDKTKYGPGDEVTVNVLATDISGNPVSTNIALWTVDKAIFELAEKNYDDIFKSFWANRYNNTTSSNSLQGIMVNSSAEKGGCFLPDTLISLANGSTKKISDIKIGDKIITRKSPSSPKLVSASVKNIITAKESSYIVLNSTLHLTADHIIFLNGAWHNAGSAQVGDILVDKNSEPVVIRSVEWIKGVTDVYNLSLDHYFTFFADGVWVHNQKGGGTRSIFNDTAYWNPSINTGSDGRAQIHFKLPDNLTTWQIAALGSSLDTKLGEAYSDIIVQKDLVIRPILPNILRQGDSLTLSAIVHNFTDLDKSATVDLSAQGLTIKSSTPQKFNLLANTFQQIYWQVETPQIKTVAPLTFSVKEAGGLSDTILQKIDILSQGYWDQKSQFAKGISTFDLNLPSNLDSNLSTIELDMSPSLLGSITSSMKYLLDYSYGCTEQTTSRLVPIILAKLNPTLFANALSGKDTNDMLLTGLARLRDLQNYDGGWSWWHGESDPFVTAYVAKNLASFESVGVTVPQNILNLSKQYLIKISEDSDLEKKVSAAYGLSYLSKNDGKTITSNFDKLTDDYLALAIIANIRLGNNNPDQNGLSVLISRAQTEGQTLYWRSGAIDKFGSIDASTALAAQALILGKKPDLALQAMVYLSNHRRNSYWYNSFATVQVINSVVDYSLLANDISPDYSYTVKLDNKVLASGNVDRFTAKIPVIKIDLSKTKSPQKLTVEKSGTGEIYSTLTSKFWINKNDIPGENQGIKITREYVNHKGFQYNIAPGDLVDVNLSVDFGDNNDNGNYAIIEDHLPAGLIPVNTHLLNEVANTDYRSDNYYKYNTEYTKDGAIIPLYWSSSKTYTYMARAISAGSFTAPPAFVSFMYNPAVFGRTDFAHLTVEDKSRVLPGKIIKQQLKIATLSIYLKWIIILFAVFIVVIVMIKKIIPYVKNKIPRPPPTNI